MKKRIMNLFLISTFLLLPSCQAAQPENDMSSLQNVPRIVYEIYPDEWYHSQAKLWKKEIDKNPQNTSAWYNYYNANRYARFEDIDQKERQDKLTKIISDMGQAIPQSYEYHLLKYWTTCDVDDISGAQVAYDINPDRPDTYYTFMTYYLLTDDQKNYQEFCRKLYDSQDIEPWLYYYNYNVLMSLESDAVLVTNGDNDTYPLWILQQVKKVRPDVTILNISLLPEESYFNSLLGKKFGKLSYKKINELAKTEAAGKMQYFRSYFLKAVVEQIEKQYKKNSLYFALTVYSAHTEPFKDDLYLTGLAYRYETERFDNLAHLKHNLENNFLLDYLDFGLYYEKRLGKNLSARIERNYVPGMIMLAEHYQSGAEMENAAKWIDFARKIAEQSDFEEALEDINQKFK